jgi:hypothetical protein
MRVRVISVDESMCLLGNLLACAQQEQLPPEAGRLALDVAGRCRAARQVVEPALSVGQARRGASHYPGSQRCCDAVLTLVRTSRLNNECYCPCRVSARQRIEHHLYKLCTAVLITFAHHPEMCNLSGVLEATAPAGPLDPVDVEEVVHTSV